MDYGFISRREKQYSKYLSGISKEKQNPDLSKIVYITIGHPKSPFPMASRINTIVWLEEETIVKVAKKMRKNFADHPSNHGYSNDQKPFNPSELYYAIFQDSEGTVLLECSDNYPGSDKLREYSPITYMKALVEVMKDIPYGELDENQI